MLSATQPLFELGKAWRSATRPARHRVAGALLASVGVFALLGARHGTLQARAAGIVTIVASVAFLLGWRRFEQVRTGDPKHVLRRLVGPVDREASERALRALSLRVAGAAASRDGTSEALASLHVERSLAQLPSREVVARASRTGARVGAFAAIVAVCAAAFGVFNGWSVLEGADVLLARRGVAPLSMTWMDISDVVARPPDYLHQSEIHESFGATPFVLPYGTTLTVRGAALHPGRTLLLSDGSTEEPFVDDGSGSVVARWKLTQSRHLQVVARFGDVVVPQSAALDVVSIADDAPIVHLDGAPRQMRLVEAVDDIAIRYDASDDHGLREIQLVLRSGVREDRRVMARLDGETQRFTGGSVLKLRDAFLAKSHAPVTVTVEAKDNDPLSGPKWGVSEAIVVIPPDVGEPEAMRLDALRRLRDSLVDTLAWRLGSEREIGAQDSPREIEGKRRAAAAESATRAEDDAKLLVETLNQSYGGVRAATPRVRSVLLGQERAVGKAVEAEVRAPSKTTHAATVKATERIVLVTDAVIRGLGERGVRTSAGELADVADDMAEAAAQMQESASDSRTRAVARMDAANTVLAAGGTVMRRLGATGRDLGEIVGADLMRVKRGRDARDLFHAELAARDLAARLRQPDPSFDARGGPGLGGDESGGAQGMPGDDSDALDDVEQAFNAAAQGLERLAQDHAGQIAKVEQALAGAADGDDMKAYRDDDKRHARTIREAARDLPAVGTGSDSWTSKGAAARDLAEQMARALEDGRHDEAAESGRSALRLLDEANRMLQQHSWFFEDPSGQHQREVEDARRRLESEARWIDQQKAELRKRASERARAGLEEGGEEEDRLAERARMLAEKGRNQNSLPERAVDNIDHAERAARDAASLLKQGDADRGLDKQREAQRALEAAHEEMQGDDGASAGNDGDGPQFSSGGDQVAIPDAKEHKGPAAFRKRVLQGLAEPANPLLKDAVKRYAEGLLR